MKHTLAIIAASILCVAGAVLNWSLRVRLAASPDGSNILEFLASNPQRSAIWARHNGTLVADFQSSRAMPLASAVKMLVATEYAHQVAAKKVNPNERVPLLELDKYLLRGTDGGAHAGWLKYARGSGLVEDEKVKVEDIARGMMQFSSNANADWLMEKLGAKNIDARAQSLGIKSQTPMFSLVGSVFVAGQHGSETPAAWAKKTRALPDAEWRRRADEAHAKLRDDADGAFKKTFTFPNSDEQSVWSDRLPAASARDYGELVAKLNSRKFFAPSVQQVLDGVLEWPLQASEAARKAYKHLGFKGGSTAWILTQVFYGESADGTKVEGAIFFDKLTPGESEKLQKGLDVFIAGLFKDEALREKLRALK